MGGDGVEELMGNLYAVKHRLRFMLMHVTRGK